MAKLDLYDIQGNIIKGYGRYGFPKARYVFFAFREESAARHFISVLIPLITTSEPWSGYAHHQNEKKIPNVTTNVAFSYSGLKHLGLPRVSLQSFPMDFTMGMKARQDILGDHGPSASEHWDPIWCNHQVDCWVSINGRTEEDIDSRYQQIMNAVAASHDGVALLSGHRGDNGQDDLDYQSASAVFVNGKPTPKEHFGYVDGISDPYFKGSETDPINVIGGGKRTRKDPKTKDGWQPLETGEFILGHRDEAYEYPASAPAPRLLGYNGTFMVYRKLHENVAAFNQYIDNNGKGFSGGSEALAAKLVGRWRSGAPITSFATEQEADQFIANLLTAKQAISDAKTTQQKQTAKAKYNALKQRLRAFDFNDDIEGGHCPVGAHTRRGNPRGALEFGVTDAFHTPGALVNRRRMLRRGLPYGDVQDPTRNDGNHGIIFMALNASIKRQFEFVQQQWMNYGNDFKIANDKDPIIGNHDLDKDGKGLGKMIIEGNATGSSPPFFCSAIPRFVETRGGEYFFIPSIKALELIAAGKVDPT